EETDEKITKWTTEGQQAENPGAYFMLGKFYESGLKSKTGNNWLFSADSNKAIEYYTKSSNKGYPLAMIKLGELYEQGDILPMNTQKAAELYQKAFETGNLFGKYAYARCYTYGIGRPVDIDKAVLMLSELLVYPSSKPGADAASLLGNIYDFDKYGRTDKRKALHFYLIAADNGELDAQINTAQIYTSGEAGETDYKKAFHYYQLALSKNHPSAVFGLAKLYANGQGTEKNVAKAKELLQSLADQGYEEAQLELKKLNN
ncbi:MAG TPA: tetratricopeptide repeat protein, partial [Methanosarcina sp.]|nr:tetratricopeptide repeat protein [Methanosarcina sp.]